MAVPRRRSQFFLTLSGDVSDASDLESPAAGPPKRLSIGSDARSERLSLCSEASAQTADSGKSRSQFYVELPSDSADSASSRTPVPSITVEAPEDEVDGGSSSGNDPSPPRPDQRWSGAIDGGSGP